jgi:hypothetical protein
MSPTTEPDGPRGVDRDLLADYLGGALDGTPDGRRVADLVAHDPAWRSAHDELAYALPAVTAALADLPPVEPMPTDVADRITAALADLPRRTPDELAYLDGLAPPGTTPAGERRLHPVPGSGSDRAAHRRRRMRRWAAPVAVAAAVAAFAALTVHHTRGGDSAERSTAGGAATFATAGSRAPNEVLRHQGDGAGPVVLASGTDYTPDTLDVAPFAAPAAKTGAQGGEPGPSVPQPLARLSGEGALNACLQAIAAAHGAPIQARTVDFASFQGSPAVVVRFAAAGGAWVWVSGPECGTPGAGPDTRYQVKVG